MSVTPKHSLPMTPVTLKGLLRSTITEVERSAELNGDDQALLELKHSLVRSVAELDVKREKLSETEADDSPAEVFVTHSS